MDSWYSKDLGDGVSAFGPTLKIQEALKEIVKAGVYSRDLAVFSQYDSRKNVVTVYFSPSARLLAEAFDSTPCEKPVPEKGFALIVGDARNWEIHFPSYLENQRNERF